jgi:hypothetical protein
MTDKKKFEPLTRNIKIGVYVVKSSNLPRIVDRNEVHNLQRFIPPTVIWHTERAAGKL